MTGQSTENGMRMKGRDSDEIPDGYPTITCGNCEDERPYDEAAEHCPNCGAILRLPSQAEFMEFASQLSELPADQKPSFEQKIEDFVSELRDFGRPEDEHLADESERFLNEVVRNGE